MAAAFKLKSLPPMLEEDEAESLMKWARVKTFRNRPLSDVLFMIPNGAYLRGDYHQRSRTMGKMHARGFRNGVSDYFLAVKMGGDGGLWLELKRVKGGIVSPDQKRFHRDMQAQGYAVAVCKGWQSAMHIINAYLQEPAVP